MIQVSRFAGRCVLLTSIAIALIGASLALPWFEVRTDTAGRASTTVEFFIDHTVTNKNYDYGVDGPVGWQRGLMNKEILILAGWTAFGLAFIAATLVDRRGMGILLGWFAASLGILGLGYFALNIGPAVEDSTTHIGFWGYEIWTQGSVTYRTSFHPSLGFWVLMLALVLMVIAFVLRSYVYLKTPREYDEARNQKRMFEKEGPWGGVDETPPEGTGERKDETGTDSSIEGGKMHG